MMNQRFSCLKLIKNQSGMITVDFIFAFVLIMGFVSVMFSLAMTLSVVEITQYVTFATARTYYGSHISRTYQIGLANTKYNELINSPPLIAFYKNGWFSIQNEPSLENLSESQFQKYKPDSPNDPNLFWGAGTTFIARILDFKIPFYGSTTSEGDGSGEGFKTFIASYLGREVTVNECINFSIERWNQIRKLTTSNGPGYETGTNESQYFTFTDNGC